MPNKSVGKPTFSNFFGRYFCYPSFLSQPSLAQDKQPPQTGADFSLSECSYDNKYLNHLFFW